MSCLAIAKRRKFNLALSLVLCVALFSTGCWGLIINGLPTDERNKGPINWGVVVLDVFIDIWLIGLVIDACAGSIRRPTFEQQQRGYGDKDKSALDRRVDQYRKMGYRLTDEPLELPRVIKLNIRPEDVAKGGERQLKVVWKGTDGARVDLYSGSVREARGQQIAVRGLAGRGQLEVHLDGECQMAWEARAGNRPAQLAGK